MKTILVPIDYSETSMNAGLYAAEFAKTTSSKLILFHAYHPPLPSSGPEFEIIPDWDLDKQNMLLLDNFKRDLLKKIDGNIEVECDVKIGFAVDEIVTKVEEKKPNLIVMGISGGGRISEFVLGSIAIGVMQKTYIPMIIVPPKALFKKPISVVFAYDYKSEISKKVMTNLTEFLQLFNATLRVLNLEKPEEGVTFEKAVNGINLESALSTVVHTLHFLPNRSEIASEINDFIDAHGADLLAMVPHRHGLLHRLFNTSITKHLAFHSHVPILALHD